MQFEEMKTDESGSIQAMRRLEFTFFALISEILGNITGDKIIINKTKDN